jgi:DNA-binding Lrp family transcriptional regulator
LLKPASVESTFVSYRPVTIQVRSSDFKIMKCLLSNPRMLVGDIAKEASMTTKTVARRLEKMRENRIPQFSILRNLSNLQITGYVEFAVIINVDISYHHQNIVERIHHEMQEHLVRVPTSYQNEVILQYSFVQTYLQSI